MVVKSGMRSQRIGQGELANRLESFLEYSAYFKHFAKKWGPTCPFRVANFRRCRINDLSEDTAECCMQF